METFYSPSEYGPKAKEKMYGVWVHPNKLMQFMFKIKAPNADAAALWLFHNKALYTQTVNVVLLSELEPTKGMAAIRSYRFVGGVEKV